MSLRVEVIGKQSKKLPTHRPIEIVKLEFLRFLVGKVVQEIGKLHLRDEPIVRVAGRHEGRHALLGEFLLLGRSLQKMPANIIRPRWQIVDGRPIAGVIANLLSYLVIFRITLHENGLVQWLDAAAHGVKVIQDRDTTGSGDGGRGSDGCRQEKHQRGYNRHGEG